MPQDQPTIVSEDDYSRTTQQRDAAVIIARNNARTQGLNPTQTADAEAVAELPYYKALTDPANPHATFYTLKNEISFGDGKTHLVPPSENPELTSIVARETDTLNAQYGTNYKPPRILVVDGLAARTGGSPLAFEKTLDSVEIDAGYYRHIMDDKDATAGLLGHELTHRYQRSDAALLTQLQADHGDRSPTVLAAGRQLESEADHNGATLSSPQAMARALDNAYASSSTNLDNRTMEYYKQTHGLTEEQTQAEYSKLTDVQKQELNQTVAALPEARQQALGAAYLVDEKAYETRHEQEGAHPSYETRMKALLQGFQSPAGTTHDAGAPPHDAATSSPPLSQNTIQPTAAQAAVGS